MTEVRRAAIERSIEAFNRQDFDAALAEMSPDIELVPVEDSPDSSPLRGHEAVRKYWLPDVFEWQRVELGKLTECGERVLAEVTFQTRGAGSGIEIAQAAYMVCTFSGELVSRVQLFLDRDRARNAAGLD